MAKKYYNNSGGSSSDTIQFNTPILDHIAEHLVNVANELAEQNRLKRIELQMIPLLRQLEQDKGNEILKEKLMILSSEASEDGND